MYWSIVTRVECAVNTMTMHWETIKHNLHFANNMEQIPQGQPGYDKLFKVHPLLSSLLESFKAILMDERLCVYEQIMPFKGKSSLKQYNTQKPKHWGYKVFVLTDNYVLTYNFELYTGAILLMA